MDSDDGASYRKWVAEKLLLELNGDEDRRRWLDKKASTLWAGVAIAAGAVTGILPSSGLTLWSTPGVFIAGGAICAVVDVGLIWRARDIAVFSRVNAQQFMSGNEGAADATRMLGVVKHLEGVVDANRASVNMVAGKVKQAQNVAAIATMLFRFGLFAIALNV